MDLLRNEIIAFVVGAFVTGSLLGIGHWLPLPGGNETPLPTTVKNLVSRYIYGTTALWVGQVIWLLLIGYSWQLTLGLMAINVAGGAVVILAYSWDYIRLAIEKAGIAEDNDQEISDR